VTSALSNMAETLAREDEEDEPISKVERMRRALREGKTSMTAADLAKAGELKSTPLVYALLRPDVDRGRVVLLDGRYAWNEHYDVKLETDVRAAIVLLRSNGYRVEKHK
jgi:hypothetical protein